MSIYKAVEWQSGDGIHWYCADTSCLSRGTASYWHPARILNMELVDFAKLLIKYNAEIEYTEHDILIYKWKKQSDMRKFKNMINAEARRTNYLV